MKKIVLILITTLIFSCSNENEKPNLLFILVDDLGWTDVSYNKSDYYETIHIDKLSETSMLFDNAYAASSVCSPTRASIMTGKHPARVNITDWIPGLDPKNKPLLGPVDRNELPLEETTIAEVLRDNNYSTFYSGKWHLGSEGHYPEDQGFDINIGGFEKGSPMGGYYSPYKNPRLSDGPEGEYLTDRLTFETIELIKNRDTNKPFAAFLSFYNVHTPIQENKEFIDYYVEKLKSYENISPQTVKEGDAITLLNQRNAKYASMVHATDQNVGRIISFLKENDIYDNTLIIFTSDNGGLSTQRRVAPTSVYPLRAGKGWLYEGGIRIPQLIKLPKQKIKEIISEPVVSYDLFPTIANILNLNHSVSDIDGLDLSNLFLKKDIERDFIFWHFPHYHGSMWKPGSALRNNDWKLVELHEENKIELYNLRDDLSETVDVSNKFPEITSRLVSKLNEIKIDLGANKATSNENYNN
ncbi:MAG: sulfatase [Bacteroidota bacterium]|nr:sulfatase [Bacteroidota bacterium]MEC8601607.1 sulfatase [Bacteroidota bacterium]